MTNTQTEKQTYNGWTNYETWNAKLWIDNDEADVNYWNEQAKECLENAKSSESFTLEENAVFELQDRLMRHFDAGMHDNGVPELPGFYADLLNAALSEINWHEIAVSLIESAKEN